MSNREYAGRVNQAARLLEAGMPVAGVVVVLADRFGCSPRQARRYTDRAVAAGGVVEVPQSTTTFTVRLPRVLVARVRQRARESGWTISAVVAAALTQFLARGRHGPGHR